MCDFAYHVSTYYNAMLVCVHVQVVCVGSIVELEELTGVKVTDLHRERSVTDQPEIIGQLVCVQMCVVINVNYSPCPSNVTCLPEPDGCRTRITFPIRWISSNYF